MCPYKLILSVIFDPETVEIRLLIATQHRAAIRPYVATIKVATFSMMKLFFKLKTETLINSYIHCQIFFDQQMFLCFIINSFNKAYK